MGAVTGIETLRVLAGAVGIAQFTVNSLARRTGVSRQTVDTVLRRYQAAFQRLDPVPGGSRGRPAVRWQLRPAAVDQVIAEVARLQATAATTIAPSFASPDPGLVEACLAMAADSLVRTRVTEPETALVLLASARTNLLTAGFDPRMDSGDEASQNAHHERFWQAHMINAVAGVLEAEVTGNVEQIDAALARALPIVRDTRSNLSADNWLPLANRAAEAEGTLLGAPVEVIANRGQKLLQTLFPHLLEVGADTVDLEYERGHPEPAGTSVLADERIALADSPAAVRPLVMFDVRTEHSAAKPLSRSSWERRRAAKGLVLAEIIDTNTISAREESEAQLVLVGHDLRRGVTRVVNRRVLGLDAGMPEHYLLLKH